jgi:histidinol-phosphate aminotransferase
MSRIRHLARQELFDIAGYPTPAPGTNPPIRLHCNENPWPPDGVQSPGINRYPAQQPTNLRNRMAGQFGVQPGNLLVTRGADDAIDLLVRGFCSPGRSKLVQCPPAFVMYSFFARLHAVEVVNVPLVGETFEVDFEGVRKAVDGGARLVFLCSPNNPTGSLVPEELVLRLARDSADKALIVLDEAYLEFTGRPGVGRFVGEIPNLVSLRTLSKSGSLAGARMGGLVANEEVVDYLLRAAVTPFPLSLPCVETAERALSPEHLAVARQRIEMLTRQREQLAPALSRFPFTRKVYPGHANFLLVHVDDAAALEDWLRQHGILVRNQSSQPGLNNHLRISVGSEEETQQLLDALDEYALRMKT